MKVSSEGINDLYLTIKAIDLKDGSEEIIDDLYWFEENGVHDFEGNGLHTQYKFEINFEIFNNNLE